MGAYISWFYENRRKKAPVRHYFRRMLRRLKLYPRPKQPGVNSSADWQRYTQFIEPALEHAGQKTAAQWAARPKIVHLIGSLQPGGAERQLCNCVTGMHKLGYDVSVLLIYPPAKELGHYVEQLNAAGVPVRVVGQHFDPTFAAAIEKLPGGEAGLAKIPDAFRTFSVDILGELLANPPDILHAWLDHSNIWGGVAALFADVPLVVLSTRNANPTHFPYLADPSFQSLYGKLAQSATVKFINNSYAGADDYANWLGLPKSRFSVVLNGVELESMVRASEQDIADFRQALAIPEASDIIAGVFRLSEEKQPLVFLQVVKRIIERKTSVVAVIAGLGPLEQEMKDFIQANGLEHKVFLLGRRSDVATLFSAAKLKLLCSRQEGTPNVLLEAQWLECPVVSTKAGGAVDAIADGETGFLAEVGDPDKLEAAVITLLEDETLRRRMAAAGPAFIRSRFGLDRMVQETLAVYNLEN